VGRSSIPFPPHIQVYVVGGAVRDRLLGLPVQDHDHVVVGATPDDMSSRGFRPVGKDFPVFLHPESQEEYALARTERKTALGYKGFSIHAAQDVTLEEDLQRRDLTINAIAEDANGNLIDPYDGQADLKAKILRHVSDAFVEDPVRILRLARFAARLPDFQIAPETRELMQQMVQMGEVDALVPERVWQEMSRGLMETRPSRMLTVLRDCGALKRLLPEIDQLFGVPQNPKHHPEIDTGDHVMRVIDQTARTAQALPVRWAALMHDVGKGTTPRDAWPNHSGHEARGVALVESITARLRVPSECGGLAKLVTAWHGLAHQAHSLSVDALLDLIEKTDALRRPDRFEQFLAACEADSQGRPGYENRPFTQAAHLREALRCVRSVDAGSVAQQTGNKAEIPHAIQQARLHALRNGMQKGLDGSGLDRSRLDEQRTG
jgi:tRNA nucleotidyltransferase (CCA-adding enzyme)